MLVDPTDKQCANYVVVTKCQLLAVKVSKVV